MTLLDFKSSTAVPVARGSKYSSVLVFALLGLSAALFVWSILVLVPAPTNWLWIAAILAGEWGEFAALLCATLAFIAFWRGGRVGVIAGVLATLAALIFCTPTARALIIARSLPARCTAAFGDEGRSARVPLNVVDLFLGIRSPRVEVTEHVYAADGAKTLKLDLYRSAGQRAAQPLVVMIHGGSWKGGNKKQLPALNNYLASRGYAVAALNYRHAPKWPFPAAVDDVFRAIEYLRAHATQLAIDPSRIVLIGRSAGGQLALSAAYAGGDPAIRGVVALYAPSDLVLGYAKPSAPAVIDSRGVLRDYLGGTPAEKPAVYAAASPINFVSSATPPTLLIHGEIDPIVSAVHSENLSARLDNAARPNLYLPLPWATHGCDANLSGPSGQLSLYATTRFLEAVFAEP